MKKLIKFYKLLFVALLIVLLSVIAPVAILIGILGDIIGGVIAMAVVSMINLPFVILVLLPWLIDEKILDIDDI